MKALIYIVDDEAALRRSLAGLLTDAGFRVKECESAESFLQLKSRYEPSCLLLDIKMGGMSGLELQAQLSDREFVPPIVFLTGNGELSEAVNSMRAGAYHFLSKPVDDDQLLETLTEAIEQSRADAEFFSFLQNLTATEQKIAKLMRLRCQTKQIAEELNTSERTIEWHRKNISRKGRFPK